MGLSYLGLGIIKISFSSDDLRGDAKRRNWKDCIVKYKGKVLGVRFDGWIRSIYFIVFIANMSSLQICVLLKLL